MTNILSALREVQRRPENAKGFTSRDVAEAARVSQNTAQCWVRNLHLAGRLKMSGTRQAYRVDGRSYSAPVYQLVKGNK